MITWRNIVDHPGRDAAVPPLLQRVAQHALDAGCASAARRRHRARDRGPRRTGAGSTSRACGHPPAAAHRSDCHVAAPLHRARRRQRGRPDGGRSAARRRRSQPGETINVQIAWTSRVPRTFARTGAIGNFYFIAQWFPKIGVLEDSGWNCHQFHAATEFFADFGVYDVRLTVPRGWIVGATGVERGRRDDADGTTTHHYRQEDVHDFAWTTSPDYSSGRARFEHPTLPPVEMRLLLQPEHAGQAERHFDATRAALKLLRRVVRRLSLRPHHHRRSGVAERRRRHGVSDAVHRRHALARAASASRSPKASPSTRPATSSGTASSPTTSSSTRGWTKGSTRSRPRGRSSSASSRTTTRSATSAGSSRGCSEISPLTRDDRRQPAAGVPAGRRERRAVDADLAYWPGTGERDHLQQDGAVAAHARADARLGHAAADHVDLLLALGVQASEAAGLLRRRQRGQRPRPDLVLRPGLPQLERVRLRRRRRSAASRPPARGFFGEATARAYSPAARGGRLFRTTVVVRRSAKASSRSTCGRRSRTARKHRWQWDGRDRWKMFEVDKPVARRRRAGRSRPRPAARRELHEQLGDAEPRRGRRGAEVVAGLAGLAAGSSAHLWVLRLR